LSLVCLKFSAKEAAHGAEFGARFDLLAERHLTLVTLARLGTSRRVPIVCASTSGPRHQENYFLWLSSDRSAARKSGFRFSEWRRRRPSNNWAHPRPRPRDHKKELKPHSQKIIFSG
jgi:hypothetical protein